MMTDPPLDEILEKIDSRFTLVIEVSKRARQLIHGARQTTACDSVKPISIAIHEINNGTVICNASRERQ